MQKFAVLCALLIALNLPAKAPPTTVEKANTFAQAYAQWTRAYEGKVPDTYSVTEERAWKQVEATFDILKKQMKVEHQ